LQILRIIQEESMKDNTAAVHAQVPVEVASFLLNEKRPEIAKIELKQRINVLLVPNKSLETPHYKLERLKHDDPRLDHIEASYTMAEEIEDPTTVTRRSQEPTNRQTPVIKGVLPDAPAPAALPKSEVIKPSKAEAVQPAVKPQSSGGFFGWLKKLLGSEPAPEAQAEPAKNVGKRGDRNSKEGDRTERGERNGDRRRGGRGGRRGDRNERGEAVGTDRTEKTERNDNTETRAPRENGGNRRNDRSGQRGDRAERGERRENANGNNSATDAQNVSAEGLDTNSAEQRSETRTERAPRGEGRRERGEGRRERGERRSPNPEGQGPAQADLNDNNDSQANAQTEATAQDKERQDESNGAPERRERRSRDRYGRDRRERNANTDNNTDSTTGEKPQAEVSAGTGQSQDEAPVTRSYFDRAAGAATPVSSASNSVSDTAQASTSAQSVPASASVPESKSAAKAPAAGLPKVQAFELPIASLIQVAEGSGLQWVNSDPDKIAQVQAAIAAEPKPVHVPRERPPAVVLDEGPLVLVETRKDLSDMKLPF
jgi:ribonuclease E